jgi:hypothetical protein
MEGEFIGSRPTRCLWNSPIKKKYCTYSSLLNFMLFETKTLILGWIVQEKKYAGGKLSSKKY